MPDYPEGTLLVASKYSGGDNAFQVGDILLVVDEDLVYKYWEDMDEDFDKEWRKTHIPVMPIRTKEVMQHKYYTLEKRHWGFEVLPVKSQIDKKYEELYT